MQGEVPSPGWGKAARRGWGWFAKVSPGDPSLDGRCWPSAHEEARSQNISRGHVHGGDHTGCPLPVWLSSVTNQHVTVKRGVKNGTKGLAKPFIYLPDQQQDSEGQANGLLIPWASHDRHKARWKKTSLESALGRAICCVLWLIVRWEVGQWDGRGVGGALPEIHPKPRFHVTTISRGHQLQSCLKRHQSQGQENSQGYDYAFEGKQKSLLVWLRWSLTKEEKDSAATVGHLAVEWHVINPLFHPVLRQSPSFHCQAALGSGERTWNRRRPGCSSWVTFTAVIHLASIFCLPVLS